MLFVRLGLPIHSKGALASCEYYATVIDGLQQKKKSYRLPPHRNNSDISPAEQLAVTTPAQLTKVAARVNPLCSLSPRACLMVEALTHEIFMALCEGVVQRLVNLKRWCVDNLTMMEHEAYEESDWLPRLTWLTQRFLQSYRMTSSKDLTTGIICYAFERVKRELAC